MIRLTQTRAPSSICMRDAYCRAVMELARKNPAIVSVEADVCSSMGMEPFRQEFPERSINCGIQEANAVTMASGMSLMGMIPTFNAFATFASRRVYDQVVISCGFAGANVKIFGGDAGITAASNGGTHMAMEDVSIMVAVPGMTVVEPADPVALAGVVPQLFDKYGNVYLRCARKLVPQIYEEGTDFTVGKANVLREGTDVTLVACGIMLAEALNAAEVLAREGISAAVIDCFTIKPLDEECLAEWAEKTGAVVTAENQTVIGGLGSMVASCLARKCPVPMEMVGVQDKFGEVGDIPYLQKKFGLTALDIVAAARKTVARKGLKRERR